MNEQDPTQPAAHPSPAEPPTTADGAVPTDPPTEVPTDTPADVLPGPSDAAIPPEPRDPAELREPGDASTGVYGTGEEPTEVRTGVLGGEEPTEVRTGVLGGETPTEVRGESPATDAFPAADAFPSDGAVPPSGAEPPAGGFPPGGGVPPSGGAPPVGGIPGAGGFGAGVPGGRRLQRSTQRKVIAGVAGGLGEFTGVDPVLFRVLFAVLTLFGGSGILLYVLGWLFLPSDDQPVSPVESLIGRGSNGSNRARDAAAAGALIVAGCVLAGVVALGDARDLALVFIIIGGAFLVIRNLQERRGGPPQPIPPGPPSQPYQAFEPLPTYQPAPVQPPGDAYQPGYQPAGGVAAPPAGPQPYEPYQATAPVAPPKPKRRRERSILGVLTLSVLLIVLGIAAALEAGGAIDPEPDDLLAVAVGVLGAGLVVGAWLGRARWLVWLGIPLLVALIAISTSGISLKGGVGSRDYAPTRASEIEPEYRIGVGDILLDLSGVDLSEQLVRTRVSAGVGSITVTLPPNADVSIDGRAGVGEIDLLDRVENGTSAQRSLVDYSPTGDGSIDLTLDLDVNIGQVTVTRAQA